MPARDGGPAFPRSFPEAMQPGMTLRDWLAGQALGSTLKAPHGESRRPGWQKDLAWEAYSIADAMLTERAKEKGNA